MKVKLKTLFYIKSSNPTDEERAAIDALEFPVMLRNSAWVSDKLESCDQVAGLVPDGYKKMSGVEIIDVKIEEKKTEAKKTDEKVDK